MVKGKKKGKKEPDEAPPSLSGLSVSEETPSTSQAPDEEEGGLGLTGAAKRKLKKQKLKEASSAAFITPTPPAESIPKVQPEPEPETQEPKPEVKTEQPKEEEVEGLGLGSTGAKRKPKKKKPSAAAESATTSGASAAGFTSHLIPEQVGAVKPSTPPVQGQLGAQVRLGQPGPPLPAQATTPWQIGPSDRRTQEGPWRASPQPTTLQDQAASRPIPAPSQLAPPAASTAPPKDTTPLPKSRQEMICRYTIPSKVLGNTIRHMPTRVITNYLSMEFDPIKVYRYDVTIRPDKPKKFVPTVFKLAKEQYYPKEFIAFDQVKNCYSLNPLKHVPPLGSLDKKYTVKVSLQDPNGRTLEFEVSWQITGMIDFGKIKRHMDSGASVLNPPTEEIQCIDVILRQGALESYVKSGRQFFKRPANPIDLSGGLEMWTGLFQSALFTSRAFINIDVAHKGFPKQQPLLQALERDFRLQTNARVQDQNNRDHEGFHNFVKNLKVIATLVGPPNQGQTREFTCNGLVEPPDKMFFSCIQDEKTITKSVADYFTNEKGYRIQYPKLNCVWVGPRDKGIYYPMELLQIAYGQPMNRQLNEFQLSNMVREAATPPLERKKKIEEVAASMNYSKNSFFKKFGLHISNEFFKVDAKILAPPNLNVGERNAAVPKRGAWHANSLAKPEALSSWGFISLECSSAQSNYEHIRDLLLNTGRSMGMVIAEPKVQYQNVKMIELRNILFAAQEKDVRFLFVIVGSKAKDAYHKVKQMAERDVGILTQCIKEYTASRRMNVATIKNILLKVNSKLMGVNQVLDSRNMPQCLKNNDVMIVGADVTHPSPEQTQIPSIAAVTASMDPQCFCYTIELSIQTPKKEMIVQFQDMIFDCIKLWREKNGKLPRKIYVFRDGVSEGQFGSVMNSELDAVHLAYRRFSPNVKPEVLFLLVQKRHHTRMFTDPHCGNVEPGTVVDTNIVHPKELDFYMVSHQAIKGTARPTRYHAVCNDGKLPHDQVEQLTFYLCHLYSRCTRSVSYPTPTYYAHLACLRARSLTHGQKFDNASLDRQPQRLRVLDKILQTSRMFFV